MKADTAIQVEPAARDFYRRVLELLNDEKVHYLVGGAFAFEKFTGIARRTKDFDIFIMEEDFPAVAAILSREGFHTELTYPHWLGKAFLGDKFVDLIFSGGNGVAKVDEEWFTHAPEETLFGLPIRISPVEETLWSKAFIMERERFDGADVAHLLHSWAERLNWRHLIDRFGNYWPILFCHLALFRFIYPFEKSKIPMWVIAELTQKFLQEDEGDAKICQGTLLSREQYLVDIAEWGYKDARLEPLGRLSEKDIRHWTAAIDER